MTVAFEQAPIFLGGVVGAGKTRLGILLDRHPRIAVTRRSYLWRKFYGRYGDLADASNLRRCVDEILASPGVGALDLDPETVWNEVVDGPPTYGHVFAVIHGLRARQLGKARWCDQLGLAETYADAIFTAYPNARMIHMVCDLRSLPVAAGPPGTIGWMTGKWLTSAQLATRNADRFGDRYLVVRNEDLRADEHRVLRDVCEFLDEEFDPRMLEDASDPMPGAEFDTLVLDPFLASQSHDAMTRFGYEPNVAVRHRTIRHRFVEGPANIVALMMWRLTRALPSQKGISEHR